MTNCKRCKRGESVLENNVVDREVDLEVNHPLIGRPPHNQNNACTLADGYHHLTYL